MLAAHVFAMHAIVDNIGTRTAIITNYMYNYLW